MAKTDPAALVADSPVTETVTTSPALLQKEATIDQAIDAWLVDVANDGTGTALRILSNQSERLKKTIHTILEEI